MTLIIDLSKPRTRTSSVRGKKELSLVLKQGDKEIASHQWAGLYQLSETLLSEIDKFLKKNKVKLVEINDIKVVPSKESMVSTRIAKAVALGLKIQKID